MSKMFFVMVFLLVIACSKTEKQSDGPEIANLNLIEGTSEVLKQNTDYYGVGYIVGKPIKGSSRGIIFNTNEVEVNMGAFGGNYIGNTVALSIEEDATAQEFNKLDRNTLYVFRYEYPHRLNPEIEDTHFHIRSWEPVNSNASFEHKGLRSYVEKKGSYSKGVRHGKVVQVERWGYWDIDCSIRISMGGIVSGKNTAFENSIYMNTYSEEACAFAEQVLKAGVDVSFEYSEDYIEIWDGVTRILHIIKITDPSEETQTEQAQISDETETT